MKSVMIIIVMTAICHSTISPQKIGVDKVPPIIKDAFKAKFPTAINTTWEMEKKDIYEANFINGKQKQSAQFDKNGKWEKTELEMEPAQLPKLVFSTFTKSFAGYKIKEAEHVETPEYKDLYELEITNGSSTLEVQISPNGDIIKQEKD